MPPVPAQDIILDDVVVAMDLETVDEGGAAGVRCGGGTGRVQQMHIGLHLLHDLPAADVVLQAPFFVAHAPEDDAGVVPSPADQFFKQAELFGSSPHQAVLVDEQDTQAVADVQQSG